MLGSINWNVANSLFFFCSPNQVAEKVASRIAEGFSDTALIMVSHSWFPVVFSVDSVATEHSLANPELCCIRGLPFCRYLIRPLPPFAVIAHGSPKEENHSNLVVLSGVPMPAV